MPYTFYEGFGNYKVLDDMRLRGYYAGGSAGTVLTPALPWSGAKAAANLAVSVASAQPGANANDPLCFPLTGKTMGVLWQNGGFALYWRQRTFIPNSIRRMPAYNGTQWVLPLSSDISGSYIGTSTNTADWEFTSVAGAQNAAANATNSITTQTGAAWSAAHSQTIWGDKSGNNLVVRYGTVTTGFGETTVVNSANAASDVYNVDTFGTRTVLTGTDGNFGRAHYSDNGGAGPWNSIPIGGNAAAIQAIRSQAYPDSWIITRAGGFNTSTDNLATVSGFQGISGVSGNIVGTSSPTAVFLCGGTGVARCTTVAMASADWTPTTLANQNLRGIAYGNNLLVMVSTTGNIYTSTDDGVTWGLATTLPSYFGTGSLSYGPSCLTFQNGRFILVCQVYGVIAESLDGATWNATTNAYPTTATGTTSQDWINTTGFFPASNLAGTPVSQAMNTGITTSGVPTQNATYQGRISISGATAAFVSPILLGPGNWHEVQIIMRPTGSVSGVWNVTFVIDDFTTETRTVTYANSTPFYPWFNMTRRGSVSQVANVVFYEFDGIADTLPQLGPDLRIFCDKPAVDEQTEWNRSSGTSNAQAVATGTVTQAQTNISEAGFNKVDQYQVANTVPNGMKILSVKQEAFFSRMLSNDAYVSLGSQVSGVDVDEPPVQVISPVNSWTYVNQTLDKDPITGQPWAGQAAQNSKFRIKRATNDPVTTMLVHADAATGGSTPYAVNIGGGFNQAGGSAAISTVNPKFGTGCIQIPSGSTWSFTGAFGGPGTSLGTYDWTIECWINTTANGANCVWQFDTDLGGGAYGGVMLTPTTIYLETDAGGQWQTSTVTRSFRDGAWHHVAVCRKGFTYYLWVDGQSGCAPLINSRSVRVLGAAAGVLTLGSASSNPFAGFIDEIRVSRGARYTQSFVPPTGPFTS